VRPVRAGLRTRGGNVLALCGRGVEIRVDTSFGRLSRPASVRLLRSDLPVNAIRIEDVDGERRVIVRARRPRASRCANAAAAASTSAR